MIKFSKTWPSDILIIPDGYASWDAKKQLFKAGVHISNGDDNISVAIDEAEKFVEVFNKAVVEARKLKEKANKELEAED